MNALSLKWLHRHRQWHIEVMCANTLQRMNVKRPMGHFLASQVCKAPIKLDPWYLVKRRLQANSCKPEQQNACMVSNKFAIMNAFACMHAWMFKRPISPHVLVHESACVVHTTDQQL